MAIIPEDEYPVGTTPAGADFPYGGPDNATTETSLDGYPWEKAGIKDLLAFFQSLLTQGLVTPSGAPDTVQLSQIFNAFSKILANYSAAGYVYGDSGVANAYVLDVKDGRQPITALQDGMVIEFVPDNTNTGPSTVDFIAIKNIRDFSGVAFVGDEMLAGQVFRMRFNSASDHWRTISKLPRGALVFRTTNTALVGPAAFQDILFDNEEYDTDSIHDNATNNNRLTVPAGVTSIVLTAHATFNNVATLQELTFSKNGSSVFNGNPRVGALGESVANSSYAIVSPVLRVVGGDYFTMAGLSAASSNILASANSPTWFAMQVIE